MAGGSARRCSPFFGRRLGRFPACRRDAAKDPAVFANTEQVQPPIVHQMAHGFVTRDHALDGRLRGLDENAEAQRFVHRAFAIMQRLQRQSNPQVAAVALEHADRTAAWFSRAATTRALASPVWPVQAPQSSPVACGLFTELLPCPASSTRRAKGPVILMARRMRSA